MSWMEHLQSVRDLGVGQLAPDNLQGRQVAFLVLAHQPRIPGDIGRRDRREPALDALSGSHGLQFTSTPAEPQLFVGPGLPMAVSLSSDAEGRSAGMSRRERMRWIRYAANGHPVYGIVEG